MRVRVWLKEEVVGLPGFVANESNPKEAVLPGGIHVHTEAGFRFITLGYMCGRVPQIVADVVEELSLLEWIPLRSDRRPGVYLHGSARAEVQHHSLGGVERDRVHIKGVEISDLVTLFQMIKANSLAPSEVFEDESVGQLQLA